MGKVKTEKKKKTQGSEQKTKGAGRKGSSVQHAQREEDKEREILRRNANVDMEEEEVMFKSSSSDSDSDKNKDEDEEEDEEDSGSDLKMMKSLGAAKEREILQHLAAIRSQTTLSDKGVEGALHRANKATAEADRLREKEAAAAGAAGAVKGDKKKGELTAGSKAGEETGVIYLAHIPHGFYERQMKHYFSQFGTVTRLRLARNPKTGKSRHYAFIEFANPQVASIVARTMDGYLLMERILVCKEVPRDKVHPDTFKGMDRARSLERKSENVAMREENATRIRVRENEPKTQKQHESRVSRLLKKEKKRREEFKKLGLDYEFPGYASSAMAKSTRIVFKD